jgi:hypothetical protein
MVGATSKSSVGNNVNYYPTYSTLPHKPTTPNYLKNLNISGSHSGEYEDDCFMGYCTMSGAK